MPEESIKMRHILAEAHTRPVFSRQGKDLNKVAVHEN